MNTITAQLRQDQAALLDELRAAGADVARPGKIRCPFHDDRHASANVYADERGVWRFKCHACQFGGDVFDVRAKAQDRPIDEVLREASAKDRSPARRQGERKRAKVFRCLEDIEALIVRQGNTPKTVYEYTDPDSGEIDLAVFRYRLGQNPPGKKSFWQARPVDGGWTLKRPDGLLPLYNRTRLRSAKEAVIVEGESCVHALAAVGIVATTAPGGAGKAHLADWSPLAGKRVTLWPDNDEPGIKHMRDVREILLALAPPVEMFYIDPANLDVDRKGDVVDYLAARADLPADTRRAAVEAELSAAEPIGAAAGTFQRIEDRISGRLDAFPWPWPTLDRLSKALAPATITLLCGDGGSTKSFMLTQAAAFWHGQGIGVQLYELEDGRDYHCERALAQTEGDSRFLDGEWAKDNADDLREAAARHAGFVESFARCVAETPAADLSLNDLAAWIEAQAARGAEIIAVDPVSLIDSPTPWVDDKVFLRRAKRAIENSGARLVLVTHPRKGRKGAVGLDELAGSTAYARFTQSVLWLEYLPIPKSVTVSTTFGRTTASANRIVHICKARNGTGAGLQVAFNFSRETLRFTELGLVVKDD